MGEGAAWGNRTMTSSHHVGLVRWAAVAVLALLIAGAAAAEEAPVAGGQAPDAAPATASEVTPTPAAPALPADAAPTPAAVVADEALPPPPPPPSEVADALAVAPPRSSWRLHRFGLAIDGGVPDLAGATILYRPWKYLRVGAGLLYNLAGYGVRGGVTILPYFAIAPSLTLEAGHYFEANAAAAVERFRSVDPEVRPLLERFGYTFANAQLGLEIGHPNWFVFFVRVGLTRLWYTPHGAAKALNAQSDVGDQTRITVEDPNIRAQFPSAKAGLIFFIH